MCTGREDRPVKNTLKKWSKKGLIYLVVIVLTVVATNWYHQAGTKKYIQSFNEADGHGVLREISDTYKAIMENYSNYKLGVGTKKRMVQQLESFRKQLEEVDKQINQKKRVFTDTIKKYQNDLTLN